MRPLSAIRFKPLCAWLAIGILSCGRLGFEASDLIGDGSLQSTPAEPDGADASNVATGGGGTGGSTLVNVDDAGMGGASSGGMGGAAVGGSISAGANGGAGGRNGGSSQIGQGGSGELGGSGGSLGLTDAGVLPGGTGGNPPGSDAGLPDEPLDAQVSPDSSTPDLESGLVTRLGFDETSAGDPIQNQADPSSTVTTLNSPTRSAQAAPTVAQNPGSLQLDGVAEQSILVVSETLPANDAERSVCLWAWYPAIPTMSADFVWLFDGPPELIMPETAPVQAPWVQFGFYRSFDNQLLLGVWLWGGRPIVMAPPPAANAWHHFCYTTSGSTHSIYFDGVLQGSGELLVSGPVNHMMIGTEQWHDEYFTGLIDDIRVYDKVLSEEAIQALANGEG